MAISAEPKLSGRKPEASLWAPPAKVESVLWSRAVALPLYQQAQVLVSGREVRGVQQGNGLAGPFSTAAQWRGTPSENDGY